MIVLESAFMSKFYITTPIYYVNAKPHIGHAYTTLVADAYARNYRKSYGNRNVFFMTGTDEHGEKIKEAAHKHNQEPKEYADFISELFKKSWHDLNIGFDHFFRTTNPRHEEAVKGIITKLHEQGDIYKGNYEGNYCVGCEKYLTEKDLNKDGKCIDHPTTDLKYKSEENYFFRISEYKGQIKKLIEDNKISIYPTQRRNEVLSALEMKIDDLSISRKGVDWGIEMPLDTSHTVYVWFEALLNYYTAPIFLNKKDFFPPDMQFMAKDIFWFHSFVQIGILLALDLPLPKSILAHGFFTINGQKMSKTLGNIIDPSDLVSKYGTDATRYLMLTAFGFGNDGDIDLNVFDDRYKGELSDGLGNLVSRVTKLCEGIENIYSDGRSVEDAEIDAKFNRLMEERKIDKAADLLFEIVNELNKKLTVQEPWKMEGLEKKKTMQVYIERILLVANYLDIFMPNVSAIISNTFRETNITKTKPLFPTL